MKELRVKYKKSVYSFCRNGTSSQIGLSLYQDENKVWVSSINSKGNVTTGWMQVPNESIPELIAALQQLI